MPDGNIDHNGPLYAGRRLNYACGRSNDQHAYVYDSFTYDAFHSTIRLLPELYYFRQPKYVHNDRLLDVNEG